MMLRRITAKCLALRTPAAAQKIIANLRVALGICLCAVLGWNGSAGAQGHSLSPTGIDYSFAGYGAGEALPAVPAMLLVHPTGGDDTDMLQQAIDTVGSMPIRADGFRGALLLAPGRYHLRGELHLQANGVVLRGASRDKTILVAEGQSRRTLIAVGGKAAPVLSRARNVTRDAAAGALSLSLESVEGLSVGDRIEIRRPSTSEWIGAIAMNNLPGTFANIRLDWQPGSHDLVWDRRILRVDQASKTISFDGPITTALEQHYGGGTVSALAGGGPIQRVGVENLTLESAYDPANAKDEEHSWIAVALDHVEDAWVRGVTARHFVASAVRVNWSGRRITIEDCRSEAPIAEEAGYRRQAFLVNGQQVLVLRCWSEGGMNDFASGLLAAGPNVFLDCESERSRGASGSFEGWASGILYERVHIGGAKLQLVLDQHRAQAGGWTAANSVLWNDRAVSVDALGPPGAPNYVVDSAAPLYEAEMQTRLGHGLATAKSPVEEPTAGVRVFNPPAARPTVDSAPVDSVTIVHGRFVRDGEVLWGPSEGEAWWRGDTSPLTAERSTGSSVSRFMPGVVAPGETEDLTAWAERLQQKGVVTLQVTPGLWYEHRRDAHNVERQEDGNVWAPFFEMPWARSGQEIAWDGLSKFDLTRYNPWYFERHKQFAREAAAHGFMVVYELYNTHAVLEIQPHYIDFPWRPANNINDTGLPEPPPFAPHNTNNIGNQFFSAENPKLRALHRAYMLHTFDELGDEPNIVFSVAYQYAGPLAFEQFFQDVAAEWSAKHGKQLRIALITGKNITDAILTDPVRSRQIAIVDMRYWEVRPDGSLWAPDAGQNLAFRKLIQMQFPGYSDTPPSTTAQSVYRQTREYRDKYPEIALMPMENGAGPLPLLMGGAASQSALVGGRAPTPPPSNAAEAAAAAQGLRGSIMHAPSATPANEGPGEDKILEGFVRQYLAHSLMNMSPRDGWTSDPDKTWVLAGNEDDPVLFYSLGGKEITVTRGLPSRKYDVLWFDPETGAKKPAQPITAAAASTFKKPNEGQWLLLLSPR